MNIVDTEVHSLAVYSNMVEKGQVNPEGELCYQGYSRQRVAVVEGIDGEIEFPQSLSKEVSFARCSALLNKDGKVLLATAINETGILYLWDIVVKPNIEKPGYPPMTVAKIAGFAK